jgi:hypothetical protein
MLLETTFFSYYQTRLFLFLSIWKRLCYFFAVELDSRRLFQNSVTFFFSPFAPVAADDRVDALRVLTPGTVATLAEELAPSLALPAAVLAAGAVREEEEAADLNLLSA